MAIGPQQDISLHSGDSRVLRVTVTDENAAALDITAAVFIWALSKKDAETVSPKGTPIVTKTMAVGSIEITNAPGGVIEITLAPADTAALAGEFYHELQMTLDGAISTVLYGQATIVKDLIQ